MIQILCRRTKNNPVLLGEAGVGKTAIVEGLVAGHRPRRRPRAAAQQAHRRARPRDDGRGHEVSRSVRRAHQSRDDRGASRTRRHPVHRRAAHAGRRRWCRGCDRRLQRAQARAVTWRDPVHRRDNARRIPQVHRERRRARAPLPDRHRRSAEQGSGRANPVRIARQVRGAPPRPLHRRCPRGRRSSSRTATSRAASYRTRRST